MTQRFCLHAGNNRTYCIWWLWQFNKRNMMSSSWYSIKVMYYYLEAMTCYNASKALYFSKVKVNFTFLSWYMKSFMIQLSRSVLPTLQSTIHTMCRVPEHKAAPHSSNMWGAEASVQQLWRTESWEQLHEWPRSRSFSYSWDDWV